MLLVWRMTAFGASTGSGAKIIAADLTEAGTGMRPFENKDSSENQTRWKDEYGLANCRGCRVLGVNSECSTRSREIPHPGSVRDGRYMNHGQTKDATNIDDKALVFTPSPSKAI